MLRLAGDTGAQVDATESSQASGEYGWLIGLLNKVSATHKDLPGAYSERGLKFIKCISNQISNEQHIEIFIVY